MRAIVCSLAALLLVVSASWGQEPEIKTFESDGATAPWQLSVKPETFDHVTLTDPLGRKTTHWYVKYRLSNRTDSVGDDATNFFRDLDGTERFGKSIDVRLSVSLIVDVPEGIRNKEKLQNLFERCELPDDLRSVDIDRVLAERRKPDTPTEDYRTRDSGQIHDLDREIHQRNMQIMNHYHQVRREADTFYYSRSEWLSWFKRYREGDYQVAREKLESLYGGKLLVASDFVQKLDSPRIVRYGEGADATTLRIEFEPVALAPGEERSCVAIFPDISPEADYIGVVFEGLVDPIVREDDWNDQDDFAQRTYVERNALLVCYSRLGDEFRRDQDAIRYLGKKWIVTERFPIDYALREYLSGDADVVPPGTWSKEPLEGESDEPSGTRDDPESLRWRNRELLDD